MMKLEIGKTYIDGYGNEVTIVSRGACNEYPFIGNNGKTYTKEGKFYRFMGSAYDLVKEKETTPTMKIKTKQVLEDQRLDYIEIEDGSCYIHNPPETPEEIESAIAELHMVKAAMEKFNV